MTNIYIFVVAAVLAYPVIVGVVIWLTMRSLNRRGRGWKVKGPALAVILFAAWAVLFGDGTLAEIGFERMCTENDAGTKIFRRVEGVEGYRAEDLRDVSSTKTSYGYRYIEYAEKTGDLVTRFVLQEDGTLNKEPHARSIAKFALRAEPDMELRKYGQRFYRIRYVIYDTSTRETIATLTRVNYTGGWLLRAVADLGSANSPLVCPIGPLGLTSFINGALPAAAPQEGRPK